MKVLCRGLGVRRRAVGWDRQFLRLAKAVLRKRGRRTDTYSAQAATLPHVGARILLNIFRLLEHMTAVFHAATA